MSTHKIEFAESAANSFLNNYFETKNIGVDTIGAGEESKAFYFDFKGNQYVFRVTWHGDLGYKKDKIAYENFLSDELVIPEVIDVGEIDEEVSFIISRRASGRTLNNFSEDEVSGLVPKIVEAVASLHGVNPLGEGYGGWGMNRRGKFDTLGEYIEHCLDQNEGEVREKSFYDSSFHMMLKRELEDLLRYCTEERVVLHNDLGPLNMLSHGEDLTIIDWGDSMYGDPLKDVACLDFWFREQDISGAFRSYYEKNGGLPEHFEERVKFYMLLIGYGSLWFYAYSDQEKSYLSCMNKLIEILES